MTDQPGVTWIPNNNFFLDRDGEKPRYVIIHGTAGDTSAVGIANYFESTQNTANPVTSTYIIGTAGEIAQAVLEKDGAWANGALTPGHAPFWDAACGGINPSTGLPNINPNNITISIECCKASSDNSDALTAPQQASLLKLVNDICVRNNIPKKVADANGGITGHFSLDPVNRSNCPGTMNWNALWSYLKAPTTPPQEENVTTVIDLVTTAGVSTYFEAASNGAWRCIKNGILVSGNILSYYKRVSQEGLNGLTHLGLPLTEMFVLKTGKAWAQLFEHGLVIDDIGRLIDRPVGIPATQPCYLAHLDKGEGQTLVAQPLTTPLNNQIKLIDAQLAHTQTKLADALKATGDPAELATLQTTITSLQGEATSKKTDIAQAIVLLQK
jgi:N-acetyl-anhydromuramyl-L-alanine amidase AmpD